MPTINANGYETYYEDDDFTDPWKVADTIWIQHGFGRSSQFWYHWVPPLSGRFRVLRRDLRGHGQSADPGPDYIWSVDDLLDDMKGFLDALGLDQVHYVGESIGGILGVAFAEKYPERFKSLTLCSTPTAIDPETEKHFILGYKDQAAALNALGPGGWVKALMEKVDLRGANPAHIDWIIKEWSKNRTHVLVGLTRLIPSVDIEPLLPKLRIPTLLLAPSNSFLLPVARQVFMRDSIPGAKIVVINARSHEIYVDEPEECITAILKFIRSLR